ncbi:TPA: YadA-like family protein [Salmonella enterica subsp. enterica serovar Kottbus]
MKKNITIFVFICAIGNHALANNTNNVIGGNINVSGENNTSINSPSSNIFGGNNLIEDISPNKNELSSDSSNILGNNNHIAAGQHNTVVGNNNSITGSIPDSGGIIIGDNSDMNNSKNGIGIGHHTEVSGKNSIAIGSEASSVNGAVALGAGSVADRENTISVGSASNNRQITNIAAGTADTDAVNVKQLDKKSSETLKSANGYTDSKITDTKNELNANIVSAKTEAISSANGYTDSKITDTKNELNTNIVSAKKEAISSANNYTDSRFKELNDKINKSEKILNAGIAGVTAISSIPYVAENTFSYGVGIGNYRNGHAIAAGIQYKTSPDSNIRFNLSWDSSHNTSLGMGIAGGW